MGARGRKKTPLKVLRDRGSWRGDLGRDCLEPPVESPRAPDYFNAEQLEVWSRLTAELEMLGLAATADFGLLERYCICLLRMRVCEKWIAQAGTEAKLKSRDATIFILEDQDGTALVGHQKWPQTRELEFRYAELRRMEDSLGLSPSARSRLAVDITAKQKPSGKARFFAG